MNYSIVSLFIRDMNKNILVKFKSVIELLITFAFKRSVGNSLDSISVDTRFSTFPNMKFIVFYC